MGGGEVARGETASFNNFGCGERDNFFPLEKHFASLKIKIKWKIPKKSQNIFPPNGILISLINVVRLLYCICIPLKKNILQREESNIKSPYPPLNYCGARV